MKENLRVNRRPNQKGRGEFQRTVRTPDPTYWDFFPSSPGIPCTDLLARVYEALERRHIPFYFSYFMGDSLATVGLTEHLRVHFFLPEHNMAIIVQGGYWFDKSDNLNDTALDLALLQYADVKTVWWTEPEVMMKGVDQLIMEVPELNMPHSDGGPIPTDYAPFDYRGAVQRPGHPKRRIPGMTFKSRQRRREKR